MRGPKRTRKSTSYLEASAQLTECYTQAKKSCSENSKPCDTNYIMTRITTEVNRSKVDRQGAVAQVEVRKHFMKNEKKSELSKGDGVSEVSVEIQNDFDRGLFVNNALFQQ